MMVFILLTKSAEFLHMYGELVMRGEIILLRYEASFSWGAPMWDVITRAGKFFAGL